MFARLRKLQFFKAVESCTGGSGVKGLKYGKKNKQQYRNSMALSLECGSLYTIINRIINNTRGKHCSIHVVFI